MNSLLSLQLSFKNALLCGDETIEQYLASYGVSNEFPPVEIYKSAYQLRLIETLKADYPMLEKLLGNDAFKELALEYIAKYPSSSFTLRSFGQHLAAFLTKEIVYKKQPYLAEMAAFEWQITDIFDSADSRLATINDCSQFKAEDWPQLSIKYHASVRWIALRWNIVEVYQALLSNTQAPDLQYSATAQQCLIWRKQYASYFRIVEAREWFAMNVFANSNFAELCQTLAELDGNDDNAALSAATYLKTWLSAELIESVFISEKGS